MIVRKISISAERRDIERNEKCHNVITSRASAQLSLSPSDSLATSPIFFLSFSTEMDFSSFYSFLRHIWRKNGESDFPLLLAAPVLVIVVCGWRVVIVILCYELYILEKTNFFLAKHSDKIGWMNSARVLGILVDNTGKKSSCVCVLWLSC